MKTLKQGESVYCEGKKQEIKKIWPHISYKSFKNSVKRLKSLNVSKIMSPKIQLRDLNRTQNLENCCNDNDIYMEESTKKPGQKQKNTNIPNFLMQILQI